MSEEIGKEEKALRGLMRLFATVGGFGRWLLGAVVLQSLWLWFVVPLGPAIPVLTFAHAVGLRLCFLLLPHNTWTLTRIRNAVMPQEVDQLAQDVVGVAYGLAATLLLWGIGWLVHIALVTP